MVMNEPLSSDHGRDLAPAFFPFLSLSPGADNIFLRREFYHGLPPTRSQARRAQAVRFRDR